MWGDVVNFEDRAISSNDNHYAYNSGWQKIDKNSAYVEKIYGDLDSKISKISCNLENFKSDYEKKFSEDNNEKISDIESSINNLQSDVKNIYAKVDEIALKIDDMKSYMDKMIKSIENQSEIAAREEKSKGIFSNIFKER